MATTVTTNDITGQRIKTPVATQQYRSNYDLIFGPKVDVRVKDFNEGLKVLTTRT